jgi:putative colanic acid biosynthesis acetyltransferase WcaF
MQPVDLTSFDNSWYRPGRGKVLQLTWFFLGLPVLRSIWLPFSGVRRSLLRLFGARIGAGVVVKPGVRVKYPWLLEVGQNTWIGEDVWLDNLAPIRIGSNACISQGAYLCTGNHDWTDPTFGLVVRPITIGDGAWIGAKAMVCPGVDVAECAVASAGCMVTRNLEAYTVYAGNPAVAIKTRKISAHGSHRTSR